MKRIPLSAGIAWIAFSSFFCFALVSSKIGNISFYLLMLLALTHAWTIRKNGPMLGRWWGQYKWLYVSVAGMAIAILAHEINQGTVQIRSYDNASRLALLGVLTWAALLMPIGYLKSLRWTFVIGTVLATIKLCIATDFGHYREGVIDFVPIIAYSQLALLLAVFALLSIVWSRHFQVFKAIPLAATGLVGLYNIYISQTRGAWIAIPVLVVLACITLFKQVSMLKAMLWSALIAVFMVAAFSTTNIVRSRFDQAVSDIHLYAEKKNLDTSIGTRFQLWNASWILFKKNPWFGVGQDNFPKALASLSEREIITPEAATYPHSHNEVLFNMATLGIFGLLGILAIYLVPIYYFLRELRHQDRQVKATAAMGLGLCLGYLVFGLVDVMFMWRICDIFYAMSIAIFLAFIIRRKEELCDV
ncbi:O-antigen ligase [Herbaspirillum sp. RV1423]|uniref:O-antigen ligase family protein n=1 Tax=Herbaspirillum sp. RV1423 TaxID=1443993 RepID=UPI00055578CF|nr:O-antigen ligase family protein [Herbaspirillum sp. RV1423]